MNRSETIGELAAALSKLQGELSNVGKNSKGYGYEYADLASVLDLIRPLLAANGLSVSQLATTGENGGVGVETVLAHSSGEWISSVLEMPVEKGKGMSGAQSRGSTITYARRYSLAAILGVAQTDDDAAPHRPPHGKPRKQPGGQPGRVAVGTTLEELWQAAVDYWGEGWAKEELLALCESKGYPAKSSDLTEDQAKDLLETIIGMIGAEGKDNAK